MKSADQIAKERCAVLLRMAIEKWRAGDKKLSKRYVSLARAIAMRHRFPLGSGVACKKCGAPLVSGLTAKTRLGAQKLLLTICLECGAAVKKGFSAKRAPKIRPKDAKRQ